MKIGKKIGGSFGVTLAILVVIGALAFWAISKLVETNYWVAHTHEVLTELEGLLSVMKDAETGQRGYLLTGGEESYLEPYNKARNAYGRLLTHLQKLTEDNPTQQERLAALLALLDDKFEAKLQQTIDLMKKMDAKGAVDLVKKDIGKKLMDDTRTLMGKMKGDEERLLKDRTSKADTTAGIALYTIGIGTVLACLFVGLTSFALTRSITGPVYRLLEGTKKIGGGQLDHRLNITTQDEIGDLARAFDRMTEKRQKALDGIRDATTRLAASSAEILSGTAEQAAGAQEQAAAVAQTVTTVDEVSQTADQAAQRAKGVSETVQRTVEIGKTGRKVVDDSLTAMGSVKEQVEATARNILTLAEQAQAIGEIIATVNDIAEQTNLLALNAAIEASRAGEHGRGFAVVAGEVKALADQSKKATAQVRQILGEIQKATNAAVLSTEDVTKGVAGAIKVSGQAGETIKALAEALTEVARAATQIVASVGQQATGMAQIHQAMKNIDQVAKQNTVATRQASQAAENLNALGTKLTALTAE